ncbi:PspA/IM30 family protein [Cuneatibacter caecimuris]|uniref:Phage shock protein A (PspA) family protein n=1 Tax=Cuneatibacter caecimuris TaxID=1796618 RepID=A0A4Q7NYR7_9FIRM|nr:PspA/IM30 family protein [Cuneatibacter caecimuris]RZS92387.1 phage shock protein A (PspA) family protein [Cuneatibacter caecimuris]
MGIIQRFADIMSANINALLDRAEDPAKMIDQYLRNLESDLGKVKAETASVMADATRAKRELDECSAEVAKMQSYAEKAIVAGNEADAKQFLMKKNQLVQKQAALQQASDIAQANAVKMRQMHDKLVNDISSLNARRDTIKAKVAAAKAQEKINQIGSSVSGAADSLSAFDRMEAKAEKMLDQANAMAELNNSSSADPVEDLAAKYDAAPDSDVDAELAALKAKMGLQ